MEIKFIKVKTIGNSLHIIRLDNIIHIGPKIGGSDNKSEIKLSSTSAVLYSTETPEEIYNKLSQ